MQDIAENIPEDEMDLSPSDITDDDASEDSHSSKTEVQPTKNLAWASVMARILKTPVPKEKSVILSKARKDSDIAEIKERKKREIEIVDESGKVVVDRTVVDPKPTITVSKLKIRRNIEKQREKTLWESMCRVKPDATQKDRERELVRIATRGVVHLFNTVEKHQIAKKDSKEMSLKQRESLGKVKGNFMDILKGFSKKDSSLESDPVTKKAKQEETWSILKDDFMMGAEMKDWDKENDDD